MLSLKSSGKTNIYTWHGLRPEACTSALLLRSPARELRPTLHCAGPTRQGDDTTCPELEKTGPEARKSPTRQGGVVHPVLCCVWSAALLWHCWHTWCSTNLFEFANVGQVLVRWSLVPSGVAKKRVGAPPACSRSARVVCEGRRLGAAATDCELAASSRAEISARMACAV